jgi:hypothetical protein
VLCQFDHVAVEVLVTRAASPRFDAGFVKHVRPCGDSPSMSGIGVVHPQADLSSRGGPLLGPVEGEVQVLAFGPGDLGVASAGPTVVDAMLAWTQFDPKGITVQSVERSRSDTSRMMATSRLASTIGQLLQPLSADLV